MIHDEIVSIEKLGKRKTVDIEVTGNHLFYANGVLTHNSNSDVDLTNTSECIFVDEKVVEKTKGVMRIADLSPGDVIKSNDETKIVTMVHHPKLKQCVKITTKSGKKIIVSKDHVFPTKTAIGEVKRISVSGGLEKGCFINSISSECNVHTGDTNEKEVDRKKTS